MPAAMWQLLAAVKRGLRVSQLKKSSRVADESSIGSLVVDQGQNGGDRHLSVFLAIVRAPMVVASCFVGKPNGMASGDNLQSADMDQFMMHDSMRYAIYV